MPSSGNVNEPRDHVPFAEDAARACFRCTEGRRGDFCATDTEGALGDDVPIDRRAGTRFSFDPGSWSSGKTIDRTEGFPLVTDAGFCSSGKTMGRDEDLGVDAVFGLDFSVDPDSSGKGARTVPGETRSAGPALKGRGFGGLEGLLPRVSAGMTTAPLFTRDTISVIDVPVWIGSMAGAFPVKMRKRTPKRITTRMNNVHSPQQYRIPSEQLIIGIDVHAR